MGPFQRFWSATFGALPPRGHVLRHELFETWFRVHNLPDGKRYADDDDERAEVHLRQAMVGDAILGRGRPCWIVVPMFEEETTWPAQLAGWFPGAAFDETFERDVDGHLTTFRVARATWEPDAHAAALRAIADTPLEALWASDDGSVYAPYDGGIDVVVRPAARRAALEVRFAHWLSQHPEGL